MSIFSNYINILDNSLSRGDSTEHTHRPALKSLIEELGKVKAINEPKHVDCGAPDFKIVTAERANPSVIGYIETKDIGKSLAETEKTEQLKRYLSALPNLLLTDYIDFRWYVDGELRLGASLGAVGKDGRIKKDHAGIDKAEELLSGFLSHTPGPVTKPEDLAGRLARLTHMLRDIIKETFQREKQSADLDDLRTAFARVLIPDIDQPEKIGEFADMYAQTIAYGLFAARCNHRSLEPFTRQNAAKEIPKTNPFLRELFDMITSVKMEDEPYAGFVDDIADLLRGTDIGAVLEHFGERKKSEDPIIHFYETFLAAYDKKLRKVRGVYYTPEPVISYIIRSVDYLLKDRFGLKDGLADTTRIKYQVKDDAGDVSERESHKVLILDPAAGTGSFLYHVIDLIRSRFMEKGNAGMWSGYVREHLLPRLFGFELLMAPYAVAHLKLGMQLAGLDLPSEEQRKNWKYDFESDERLKVYLTNTLEEAEKQIQQELLGPMRILSEEAAAADEVKKQLPIMVIIGNPPYSGHSANDGEWIKKLVQDEYYPRDHIKEKNPKWLLDDYVKFIRWAQWRIEQTGSGILGFITNHSYIDNPTFRQMRKSLMDTFDEIYIYDLHGNVKKKETASDGSKDENVFDIQQGVAICLMVKHGESQRKIGFSESLGTRELKYQDLKTSCVKEIKVDKLEPIEPLYFLKPFDAEKYNEYNLFYGISDIFPINSVGIVTARDSLTIHFTKEELEKTIKRFISLDEENARREFNLGKDARDWKVTYAQNDLKDSGLIPQRYVDILYRPYDFRRTYYTDKSRGFICMPMFSVMQHMLAGINLGIITTRNVEINRGFEHVFITNKIVQHHIVSQLEVNYLFPLYLYQTKIKSGESKGLDVTGILNKRRIPNLDERFIEEFSSKLGMKFIPEGMGDGKKTFGPEDVLHYIYAVFHSPTYRERYSEFLKIDFPRVPLTSDAALFCELRRLGRELTGLHLLETVSESDLNTSFPRTGSDIVEKGYPKYLEPGALSPLDGKALERGRVFINPEQYFDGVEKRVWEFHIGGYQVPHKWLKDRRGRKLTYDDKVHYQKTIHALGRTIDLMKEIDHAIPSWPIL